jgi:tetratricopeptide (TPR) repeat protein
MDYSMAAQYYEHLIDEHPGQRGFRTRLGFAFIQLGENERARKVLIEESRLFPEDRDVVVLLCYAFYLDNDCQEAKNTCSRYGELIRSDFRKSGLEKISDAAEKKELRERIIRSWKKTNPNIGLPDYILGHCLKQEGHYEEAKTEFLRASEMAYDRVDCQVQLIDVELEARNWSGALARVRDAVNSMGDRPEFAFLEGYAYYGLGNAGEAIRSFQRTCDLKPNMSEALKNLAKLHLFRGEYGKAVELINRVKALAPSDLDAQYYLGESLKFKPTAQDLHGLNLSRMFVKTMRPVYRYTFRNDMSVVLGEIRSRFFSYLRDARIDEAVNYLDRFIKLYDGDASLNFSLANLLKEKQRYEECLNFASRVIELDRNHKDAHDLLGDAYFAIGDFFHSLQAYQEVIRIVPNDAMAHYNLGCAYSALGELGQAEIQWKDVLRLDKSSPPTESNPEASKSGLDSSVTVRERTPAFFAHLALGRLYAQKGLPLPALEEFKEAAGLVPHEPDLYYEMGRIYMRLRERERAVACFEKYLNLGGKKESEVRGYLRVLKLP